LQAAVQDPDVAVARLRHAAAWWSPQARRRSS
jgi:hypothetical protein